VNFYLSLLSATSCSIRSRKKEASIARSGDFTGAILYLLSSALETAFARVSLRPGIGTG